MEMFCLILFHNIVFTRRSLPTVYHSVFLLSIVLILHVIESIFSFSLHSCFYSKRKASVQLSKPSDATYSARPVGQPGCGRRLPQHGQLTIGEELLGYHNNNNVLALSGLLCADVPLRSYSLTHSLT